ncbi:hypothetical protein EVJ58_g9890 [Rhodofomes roseus]|uniref:Uncharacterized protein n=1 Tax=Rhodofomes roseus TaxID=34475 RepID=A0A4Y9XTC5_9APHY|nr:hypothetical protein EVJ58_g9890 [Rhodofomes roseus]
MAKLSAMQYRFGEPPTPGWEPQGHWGGQDYFTAHAFRGDQAFYQAVMGRMSSAVGVGFNEARYWHRRIYGGLVNLSQLLPADIGAAAAYEAYRIYKYRRADVFDPLGQDIERQREALIAIAFAETTQLWQFTGRALDSYGQQDAAEAAVATAARIARRVLVPGEGGDGLRRHERRHGRRDGCGRRRGMLSLRARSGRRRA